MPEGATPPRALVHGPTVPLPLPSGQNGRARTDRVDGPGGSGRAGRAHPASQNANPGPLVEGPAITLAGRHTKVRREGYPK